MHGLSRAKNREPSRLATQIGVTLDEKDTTNSKSEQSPLRRVRLPGFLIEEEIGLGDAIKRVTYAMGIKPCSGCEKRASALNRRVVLSR